MYLYYNQKGLPCIILAQACGIISLGFTVSFSAFLIAFVKWNILVTCKDEESCQDIYHYIRKNPYEESYVIFSILITTYIVLFSSYWIFKCYSSFHIISNAFTMEKFYREKLGVRLNDLYSMRWHEVVERLIKLHDHGILRVAVKEKLNEHDIVLRIMRKENYMIALINKQVLNMRCPWWIAPFTTETMFLTKSLEWSISFCILEYMFNDQFQISKKFIKDIFGLKRRFIIVGIVHTILLPFMLVFMSIHFFLQNAQQFHSSRAYLGPRQFSPLALWTFRDFNELPHFFEARINQAYRPSNDYLSLFNNPQISTVARCVSYILGSFLAALLLISFLGEGILLHVHAGDHNLLWFLGVFTAIFAGTRSLVPEITLTHTETHEELMNHIAAHTHHFPPHWENSSHTQNVKNEFSELCPYKIKLFFLEVLSVLLTPIVLLFSLPQSASAIIDFIRENSTYVDGLGAVCVFSLFELERFGDEQYGAPVTNLNDSHLENGKLEQSFINFQQNYPHWQMEGDNAGRVLLDNIHAFRNNIENKREEEQARVLQNSLMAIINKSNTVVEGSEKISPNKMPSVQDVAAEDGEMAENDPLLSKTPASINQYATDRSIDMFISGNRSQYESQDGTNNNNLPSILRSILKQENIDYENDFYWLNKFRNQRRK